MLPSTAPFPASEEKKKGKWSVNNVTYFDRTCGDRKIKVSVRRSLSILLILLIQRWKILSIKLSGVSYIYLVVKYARFLN